MVPIEAPAPAQADVATPAPTAVDQAVISGDQSAYAAARRAERAGTPLAPAPADAAQTDETKPDASALAPTQPERTVSKRQEQINTYERTIAELKAENARLKQPPSGDPAAPRSEAPKPTETAGSDEFPEYDIWAAKPDNQGKTYERYLRDAAAHDRAQEAKQAQQTQAARDAEATARSRWDKFNERMAAARAADPKFDEGIAPELFGMVPLDSLEPGKPAGVQNAVAQVIRDSEQPDQWLRHFTNHPEDMKRLGTFQSREEFYMELGAIRAGFSKSAAAPPPPPPITNAPTPPTTLGSKPADQTDSVEAAVRSGDVGAFRAARLRERTANMR